MKCIIYDTETTGLTRKDEVIQFAAVITDETLFPTNTVNFYCYTQVPISKKASELTGISAGLLHRLSNGRTFEDNFLELPFVGDSDLVWVSYSTNGFDERLVNQTLANNGLPRHDFGKREHFFRGGSCGVYTLDAYSLIKSRLFNGKDNKLSTAAIGAGISGERTARVYRALFSGEGNLHDASYDAFLLWYLLYSNKERLGIELC